MTKVLTPAQHRIHEGIRLVLGSSETAKMGGGFHSMLMSLAVSFCLYACYKVFIYPFFVSPLRKVPEPSVGSFPIVP